MPPLSWSRAGLKTVIALVVVVFPMIVVLKLGFSFDYGSPTSLLFESSTNVVVFLAPAILAAWALPSVEALLNNNALPAVGTRTSLRYLFRKAAVALTLRSAGLYAFTIGAAGFTGYLLAVYRPLISHSQPPGWGGDATNFFTRLSGENFLGFLLIYMLWIGFQAGFYTLFSLELRLLNVRAWIAYMVPTLAVFAFTIAFIAVGLGNYTPQRALGPMITQPLAPRQYLIIGLGQLVIAVAGWVLVERKLPEVLGAK